MGGSISVPPMGLACSWALIYLPSSPWLAASFFWLRLMTKAMAAYSTTGVTPIR